MSFDISFRTGEAGGIASQLTLIERMTVQPDPEENFLFRPHKEDLEC